MRADRIKRNIVIHLAKCNLSFPNEFSIYIQLNTSRYKICLLNSRKYEKSILQLLTIDAHAQQKHGQNDRIIPGLCVPAAKRFFSFVRLISIVTECNLNDLTNNKPFETQLNIIILTHTMQR